MRLDGTISRVTVRKTGGWGIAQLKSGTDKITIVGTGVGDLLEGSSVSVTGYTTVHARFGEQFAVTGIEHLEQQGHPGIENAVMSFRGIGKAYASQIQQRYAGTSPRQFTTYLTSFIDPSDVVATWVAPVFAEMAEATKNLGPHGLSAFMAWMVSMHASYATTSDPNTDQPARRGVTGFTAEAHQALKTCLDLFKRDPYAALLHRYGLADADRIVLKHRLIDPDSPIRLERILHAILRDQQDTLMPIDDLCNQAADNFEIDLGIVTEPDIWPKTIMRVDIDGVQYAASQELMRAEHVIMAGIDRLMREKPTKLPQLTPDELCAGLPSTVKLTKEQLDAVHRSASSAISIITGCPGVGKTASVLALINILKAMDDTHIYLAAPTNKAARRLQSQSKHVATSIHKLLTVTPIQGSDRFGNPFVFARDRNDPFNDATLIIDECSMIDTRLFAAIMDAIGENCRLVLIGDHEQLPPIQEGAPFQELIDKIPTSRLTKILRSKPGQMQKNYLAIHTGKFDSLVHKKTADWEMIDCGSDDEIMRVLMTLTRDMPTTHGPYGFQIITPRRSNHALSTYQINRRFREVNLGARDTMFVPGDKGMCLHTAADIAMVNGDLFVVRTVDKNKRTMEIVKEVSDGDTPITVPLNMRGLDFAWATTVHKYQGCETNTVIFVCSPTVGQFLNRNMVYTAITRAREKVIVLGSSDAFNDALRRAEPVRQTAMRVLTNGGFEHGIRNRRHLISAAEDSDTGTSADWNGDAFP